MLRDRFRWGVVALLFAITMINYIDRSAIAFAVHDIETELNLNSALIGLMLGAFGIGYILTALIGGVVADRYGAKVTLATVAILWSLAIGATGLATGFIMLYASRVALGAAEGPTFPATEGALSRWLPPGERATAFAGALVAVPLSLAIGAALVSNLIAIIGWRATFIVLAALVLLWLPLWLFFFSNDPARSRFVSDTERKTILDRQERAIERGSREPEVPRLRAILRTSTLWANCWAYFVFGYFLFFFMTWLPSYLRKAYGLDLTQAGLFTVLPWVVAAVSLYVFGLASDRALRRTGSLRIARTRQIALTQIVAALAVVPVALMDDFNIALAGITVAVAAALAPNAAFYAVVVDLSPRYAATILGIMTIWFAGAGFLAPAITGAIVEITSDFRYAFLMMALLAASSVVVLYLFHHPDRDAARLAQDV